MRDICFRTPSLSALVAALKPLGLQLTSQDESGNDILVQGSNRHALAYHPKVEQTQAITDAEGNAVTPAVLYPGEYAVLTCLDDALAAAILSTSWPEGIEIVPPFPGLPLPGGQWREPQGPNLEEVKAQALVAIDTAMDSALSWLLAGGPASASVLAASAAMMATSDPEGLEMTHDMLAVTANALRTAVAAAQTVEQVRAVVIGFSV